MIFRALTVWVGIIVVESLHGIFRQLFVVPELGDLASRQIGVLTGSILILAVVWISYRWLGARAVKHQLLIGVSWCVLTFVFELSLGLALGFSVQRILSDYDLSQGGFMAIGMLVLALSLVIVSKGRGK